MYYALRRPPFSLLRTVRSTSPAGFPNWISRRTNVHPPTAFPLTSFLARKTGAPMGVNSDPWPGLPGGEEAGSIRSFSLTQATTFPMSSPGVRLRQPNGPYKGYEGIYNPAPTKNKNMKKKEKMASRLLLPVTTRLYTQRGVLNPRERATSHAEVRPVEQGTYAKNIATCVISYF